MPPLQYPKSHIIRIPGKPLTKINSACQYGDKSSIVKLQNNVEMMKTADRVFFNLKDIMFKLSNIRYVGHHSYTERWCAYIHLQAENTLKNERTKERKSEYMHVSNTFDYMFKSQTTLNVCYNCILQ